jgi:hypothetical protein
MTPGAKRPANMTAQLVLAASASAGAAPAVFLMSPLWGAVALVAFFTGGLGLVLLFPLLFAIWVCIALATSYVTPLLWPGKFIIARWTQAGAVAGVLLGSLLGGSHRDAERPRRGAIPTAQVAMAFLGAFIASRGDVDRALTAPTEPAEFAE